MTKASPLIFDDRKWLTKEYGFYLYPEQEVRSEKQRLQRTRSPRSPSNLASERKIIAGVIEDVYVKGNPEHVPEAGQTLIVEFEDDDGGTSELRFKYELNRRVPLKTHPVSGWMNATLHPSEELASNPRYEWDDPQDIDDLEFI